jgi:hypothetical protein
MICGIRLARTILWEEMRISCFYPETGKSSKIPEKRMGGNRKKVVLEKSGKRIEANPPFKDISQK